MSGMARQNLAAALAGLVLACAIMAPAAAAPANPPAKPAAVPGVAAPGSAAATLHLAAGPADAATMTALSRVALTPLAQAAHLALADAGWDGSAAGFARLAAQGQVDLALLDGASWNAACAANLLAPPPAALVRESFVPGGATACGIAVAVAAQVLAWDTAKLSASPSWADFFNVARIPGRRGLRREARGTLEAALLADGVAPSEVYRVLKTPEGTERAFRKLEQLRPYIAWWSKPAEPAQLLAAGQVALTTSPATTIAGLRAKRRTAFAITFDGALFSRLALAVPRAAPSPDMAWLAVTLAADPLRQLALARATGLAPGRLAAVALLGADAAESPSLAGNLKRGLDVDEGFWQENGARLAARFAAFLAK